MITTQPTMTTTDDSPAAAPPRARRARRQSAADGGAPRRRRQRMNGDDLIATLAEQVDQLIRENRELRRALARRERAQGSGGDLGQAAKTLSGLQRRISRALDARSTPRRGRSAAVVAPAPRPRRKVTDPELLERRRQALAKARAARAAKRQAANSSANSSGA